MTQVAAYIAGPQRSASPPANGGGLESAFPCPKPPPRLHPGALPESQKKARSYRSMQEANCRISSVVEQRFCKPLVGSSNLSSGTTEIRRFAIFSSPPSHLHSVRGNVPGNHPQTNGNATRALHRPTH